MKKIKTLNHFKKLIDSDPLEMVFAYLYHDVVCGHMSMQIGADEYKEVSETLSHVPPERFYSPDRRTGDRDILSEVDQYIIGNGMGVEILCDPADDNVSNVISILLRNYSKDRVEVYKPNTDIAIPQYHKDVRDSMYSMFIGFDERMGKAYTDYKKVPDFMDFLRGCKSQDIYEDLDRRNRLRFVNANPQVAKVGEKVFTFNQMRHPITIPTTIFELPEEVAVHIVDICEGGTSEPRTYQIPNQDVTIDVIRLYRGSPVLKIHDNIRERTVVFIASSIIKMTGTEKKFFSGLTDNESFFITSASVPLFDYIYIYRSIV